MDKPGCCAGRGYLEDILVEMPRRPERWREVGPGRQGGQGVEVMGMAESREAGLGPGKVSHSLVEQCAVYSVHCFMLLSLNLLTR